VVGFGDATVTGDIAKLLQDEEREVRVAALEALRDLQARDLVPVIAKCLKDPAAEIRFKAAHVLAWLGSSQGAQVLVEAVGNGILPADRLNVLNALRQSEVWSRLEGVPVDEVMWGPMEMVLTLLAERAGLRIQLPGITGQGAETGNAKKALAQFIDVGEVDRPISLTRALEASFADTGWGFVLEDEVIKVIGPDQIMEFWKHWAR
jgi:hypothetical protein